MYHVNENLAGVWGLDTAREYTQAEIDASDHLQWAVRAGALGSAESALPSNPPPAANAEPFEIDLRDGVNDAEASHAGQTLSRRARERKEN